MTITEVNIVFVKPDAGLLGFCSFVVNNDFYFGNIAIFTKKDGSGIRLVYPQKNGIDCVHPINRSVAEAITQEIMAKLRELNRVFS